MRAPDLHDLVVLVELAHTRGMVQEVLLILKHLQKLMDMAMEEAVQVVLVVMDQLVKTDIFSLSGRGFLHKVFP